ncbi:MAG: hypothetical protein WCQ41_10480 [Bacillota bacterium]
MKTIHNLLSNLNISDARSALYYLSRYLKQAPYYEKYEKDIFDDAQRSYPNESIRSVTLALIKFIEQTEQTPIAKFDDATYIRWSDHVEEVESGLDPEASLAEIEQATAFANTMNLPSVGNDS